MCEAALRARAARAPVIDRDCFETGGAPGMGAAVSSARYPHAKGEKPCGFTQQRRDL
jgi:hypothetical protein